MYLAFFVSTRQNSYQSFEVSIKQEAQLMLTNPRDAFRGQLISRSPTIVPFHMLGIVYY